MIAAIERLYLRQFPRPGTTVADAMIAHQLRQFGKQVPILHVVAAFNTAVVIAASWRDGVAPLQLLFPALIIMFSFWRIAVWRRRPIADLPRDEALRVLTMATRAIVVAVGLASGWTVWTFATGAYSQPTLVPISLAVGMFCVAHCLGVLPVAAIAALVVGAVPISVAMLSAGNFLSVAVAVTILSGTLFQLRVVRDHYLQLLVRLGLEAQVRALAHTDELTLLPNRRAFLDALDTALGEANSRHQTGVALIDLDGFKGVNDTLGHSAGDSLLRTVADRLRGACVDGDIIARLGGDEFVVLFQAVRGYSDADARALRIVAAVCGPVVVDGASVVASASVGFALSPGDANSASHLLALADHALYIAKADGKGRARRYLPPGARPSRDDRRADWEAAA